MSVDLEVIFSPQLFSISRFFSPMDYILLFVNNKQKVNFHAIYIPLSYAWLLPGEQLKN